MKNNKSKNTKKTVNLPDKVKTKEAVNTTSVSTVVKKPNESVIEIQKFVDDQGVSICAKKDSSLVKSSKLGITPTIFYDSKTNFKSKFDEIDVVTQYDPKFIKTAVKIATEKAKTLANEAVIQFDHDVERIKHVTNKNLEIARVEALRVLTKALILEKNHHEQVYEKKCHVEALKSIALLKEARTLLNDGELPELLLILKHDYELELKNNDIDHARAQIKIDEMQTIFQIKRKLIRQQIKDLNQGRSFNLFNTYWGRITPIKLISEIKRNRSIPSVIETENAFASIAEFKSSIKNIDVKKLSASQQKIWQKFTDLLTSIENEEKYIEKLTNTQNQLDELANEIRLIRRNSVNSKNLVTLNEAATKSIVDAKKQSLIISKPACLYAVNIKHGSEKKVISKDIVVKTKTIQANSPRAIDPIIVRQPVTKIVKISNDLSINKESTYTKSLYSDDTLNKQMNKFQKLQGSDFDKRKHLKLETIEYTNYKWEWKTDALANRKSAVDNYYTNIEYQSFDAGAKNTINFKQLFKTRDEKNIAKLKKLVADLPTDPIIVNNAAAFKKENLNVEKIIKEFTELTDEDIVDNSKNEKLISDIETILQIYNELVKTDIKYRKGLLKAQLFDRQLAALIQRQDLKATNFAKKADLKYQKNKNAIEELYQLNLSNAKNQYLIHKELIIDQEQASYAKEEETYLWNSCLQYKRSNDFMNQEFKYENNIISNIISDIEKFNRKSNNPISLSNIPSKILPLPIHSNARIDISFEKIGSNQYAVAHNTDHKNKLLTQISTDVDGQQIQKIYVLDKFRAVKDIKTRVALLTEFANNEYLKVIQANKVREAREIKVPQAELQTKLNQIDKIYNEIDIMTKADGLLSPLSEDAKAVQQEFVKVKQAQWSRLEKAIAAKKLETKEADKANNLEIKKLELEHLKQEKSKDRAISIDAKSDKKVDFNTLEVKGQKNAYTLKSPSFLNVFKKMKKNDVSIDEIIGKK